MYRFSTALLVCISIYIGERPAVAGFITGNELLEKCEGESGSIARGYCYGYVAAVNDSFLGVAVCLPGGVQLGQLIDVTTVFLRGNPQRRHQPAAALVWDALTRAFPC